MVYNKGSMSIQFNWILVLIIGGLILTFFISVVQKQRSVSEENIASSIQTDLQSILASSHVSTETASVIEIPSNEIQYSCEGFKVGNQFPTKFRYTFAPDLLKSDRNTISVFSYDWSMPYKITNFLYVTSPDIKYLIDSSSIGFADLLEGLMPPQYITKDDKQKLFMNRELGATLNPKNNYKVRIIGVNKDVPINRNQATTLGIKPRDFSSVYIDLNGCTDSLDCAGTLTFYNYDDTTDNWPGKTSYFVGKASLLAAIFSENAEIYGCGMDDAFTRLNLVSSIYYDRTHQIQSYYSSLGEITCQTLLGQAVTPLGEIVGLSSLDDYNALYSNAVLLEGKNNDLLINSCPAVY